MAVSLSNNLHVLGFDCLRENFTDIDCLREKVFFLEKSIKVSFLLEKCGLNA